jgi:branched-chain amino acid transport system substrate-binding protein
MALALTGYLAGSDGPVADGAKLAAEEINQTGGILGRPLELDISDMASAPTNAVNVTNQLLNQKDVAVMANGSSSAGTQAVAPINAASQVPMVVGSILPKDPTWVYSVLPPPRYLADIEVGFAANNLKARSVAILYSQTPYGQLVSQLMARRAAELGMSVTEVTAIDANATDVSPQLARIKDARAEAIVDVLTGPIHLVLVKSALGLGLDIPLVMAQDDLSILKQASDLYPNVHFAAISTQVYPDVPNPAQKEADGRFLDRWTQTHGGDVRGSDQGGRGYDMIYIIAQAMEASRVTTGEKVRAALEQMQPLQGVSALYHFTPDDHNGMDNPFFLARYAGGTVQVEFTPS